MWRLYRRWVVDSLVARGTKQLVVTMATKFGVILLRLKAKQVL